MGENMIDQIRIQTPVPESLVRCSNQLSYNICMWSCMVIGSDHKWSSHWSWTSQVVEPLAEITGSPVSFRGYVWEGRKYYG